MTWAKKKLQVWNVRSKMTLFRNFGGPRELIVEKKRGYGWRKMCVFFGHFLRIVGSHGFETELLLGVSFSNALFSSTLVVMSGTIQAVSPLN